MVPVLREPSVEPVCDESEQVVTENREEACFGGRAGLKEEDRRGVGMPQALRKPCLESDVLAEPDG